MFLFALGLSAFSISSALAVRERRGRIFYFLLNILVLLGAGSSGASLSIAVLQEGDLARAVELMQARVDYERELGHPDAEKHAAEVERLRKELGQGDDAES